MINYQALISKYPYRLSIKRSITSTGVMKGTGSALINKLVMVFIGFVAFILAVSLLLTLISSLSNPDSLIGLLPFGAIIIIILYILSRHGRRILALEGFCSDNGFVYAPSVTLGQEAGSLFKKGHSRRASNGIHGTIENNSFDLFDYSYVTGSGKNSRTHRFGVARLHLPRQFPHILLDNKRDGSLRGFEFDQSQRLELEGDFNKYFTVFGPKEYEIEVLQVLNPSVMSKLVELDEPFDIEIIGTSLYLYNSGLHTKTKTIQAIFGALEAISASTQSVQRSFSMPEQIGNNKPLLKKSVWPAVITVLMILIYVAFQLLPFFQN